MSQQSPLMKYKHPFIHGCDPVPKEKEEELKQLRSWLSTRPYSVELTDDHLHLFLHVTDFDLAVAKKKLDTNLTMRSEVTEIFSEMTPTDSNVQAGWDIACMVSLPKRTTEGYPVMVYKFNNNDINIFNIRNIAKALFLVADIRTSEDGIVPGYVMVIDVKGVLIRHLLKIDIATLRAFLKYIQDGGAVKIVALHVINTSKAVKQFVTFIKAFIKLEIFKVTTFHTEDLSNFSKEISLDILPSNYGGFEESVESLHEKQRTMAVEKYQEWSEENELCLRIIPKSGKK